MVVIFSGGCGAQRGNPTRDPPGEPRLLCVINATGIGRGMMCDF
jgi:hypothetical protein